MQLFCTKFQLSCVKNSVIKREKRVEVAISVIIVLQIKLGGMNKTVGTLAGWHRVYNDIGEALTLHQITLPTVNKTKCWSSFLEIAFNNNATINPREQLTENMFCSGYNR